MTPGIYSTISAINARWSQQEVASKNISNASTPGNKRQVTAFASLLKHSLSEGLPLSTTLLNESQPPAFDLGQGPLQETNQPLDAALINKYDFFQVQTPLGTRLTRNGHFRIDGNRQIVNEAGYPALNINGQPITLPAQGNPAFSPDGGISVDGQTSGDKLGVVTLDPKDAGKLASEGNSTFTAGDAQLAASTNPALLTPGHLESSNVEMSTEMIQMIQNQRMFDMLIHTLQMQDDGLGRAIQDLSGVT